MFDSGYWGWVLGFCVQKGTGPDVAGGPLKGFVSSSLFPLSLQTFFTCLMTWQVKNVWGLQPNLQLGGYLCPLPQAAASPTG